MPCYSSCKKCKYFGNVDNNRCTECYSNYYLNNSNCYEIVNATSNNIINIYNIYTDYENELNIYYSDYLNTDFESNDGKILNNKSTLVEFNFTFQDDYLNDTNCFKICKFYYYFDNLNKCHCLIDNYCPKEYNKLIREKNQCIDNCSNDDIYKYEYNNKCYTYCPEGAHISKINKYMCEKQCQKDSPYENIENNKCIKECNATDLFKGVCIIKNKDSEIKDKVISLIKKQLINGGLDNLIYNLTKGITKDIIIQNDNITYQITSTTNMYNNVYDNISTIILGECENK